MTANEAVGMQILVTNDDGVDSPALPPLARALRQMGRVSVAAPDGERSWSGKHLSRLSRIPVAPVTRDGIEMLAVGGSPADAAQIGCHRSDRPDLVVSGINLGHNHGSSFLMSSGTVGAAIEAELSGHPAIAVSVGISEGDYLEWHRYVRSPDALQDWARVADLSAAIVGDVWLSGMLDLCDVVSVNMPWEATRRTPRRVTTVARTRYGAVYRPADDGTVDGAHNTVSIADSLHDEAASTARATEHWIPSFTRLEFLDDDLSATDIGAAHRGEISITPVHLPRAAQLPHHVVATAAGRAADAEPG